MAVQTKKSCCGCAGEKYICRSCSCSKNFKACTNCAASRCENSFTINEVDRDGNCLFRCLSKWMYQTEDHHDNIRHVIIDQIKSFKEFYATQIDPNRYPDVDSYVREMEKDGVWGDDVTMIAFSEAYKYDIFAKTMGDRGSAWTPYSVWACDHDRSYVTLINLQQNHFQLVTDCQRPCQCIYGKGESINGLVEIYNLYKSKSSGTAEVIIGNDLSNNSDPSVSKGNKNIKSKEVNKNNKSVNSQPIQCPILKSSKISNTNKEKSYDERKISENSNTKRNNENGANNISNSTEENERVTGTTEDNSNADELTNQQILTNEKFEVINNIYNQIIHFKGSNLFTPPNGNSLKKMMDEITNLLNEYNNDTPSKQSALKMVMIMPKLLLQRPHAKSSTKENNEAFKRRMILWNNGELEKLLQEAKAIQKRLNKGNKKRRINDKAFSFRVKMEDGQVRQASKMLQEIDEHSIVPINRECMSVLREKHPKSSEAQDSALIKGDPQEVHEAEYNAINAEMVKRVAMQTKGAAGPSGMDAKMWRRLLTSRRHVKASTNLASAIAVLTKKMCIRQCHHMEAITASRLIAAKKQHNGIRPIGVGEVLRRIMGKCVMRVVKYDVMEAVGNLQLCAGQEAGAEAAIHAVNNIYEEDQCQAILMVDAENAFNVLNRKAMIHNIAILCPSIATFVENTYKDPSRLILANNHELLSEEGTTQGDPIAMAIYALGFTVLQDKINYKNTKIKQVAFADDLTGAGSVDDLKIWWDTINQHGPALGYHPNSAKSCLIVKSEYYAKAKNIFAGTNVKVTSEGERHLGAVVGSQCYREKYVKELINIWVRDVEELAHIAKTEPHAAYTNFTFSTKLKWNYALRTIKGMECYLQPLENAIRKDFIPAILGCNVSEGIRNLLSLPPKLGGMGIINPIEIAKNEYNNSNLLTTQLKDMIINQDRNGKVNNQEIKDLKKKIAKERETKQKAKLKFIEENELDENQNRRLKMAQEKGASSWLTTLPLKDLGFSLNKQEFRDTVALRYSPSTIKDLPSECACGDPFTTDHAMICKNGGFISIRHNELRDTIYEMMDEVCTDVRKEPMLMPLSGEEFRNESLNKRDNARVDVSARDFWSKGQTAFFDIRVFDPMAQSYSDKSLESNHKKHEKDKRIHYEDRITKIERGSFTPLVFTIMGGASIGTQKVMARLAEKLASKRGMSCAIVIAWMRCKVSFALLRGANLCLRGTRRRKIEEKIPLQDVCIDTAVIEGNIPSK